MSRTAAALVVSVTTVALLSLSSSAVAGGGSWGVEGQRMNVEAVLLPGEVVHAETLLWTKGVKPRKESGAYWGGPEHGPYFGYISPRRGTGWGAIAPPVPDNSITVGKVRFTKTKDPAVLDVSLDFVMPDLEPGYYMLHHCNVPCSRQIGDTMSTPITVVEDRGQALLAARLAHLDTKLIQIRPRVQNRMDNLASRAVALESGLESLEKKIRALEAKPAASTPESGPSSEPARREWMVGAALAAAVTFLLLAAIRRTFNRRTAPDFP